MTGEPPTREVAWNTLLVAARRMELDVERLRVAESNLWRAMDELFAAQDAADQCAALLRRCQIAYDEALPVQINW